MYISGIVTIIPKQSECNVNSYNKDTVASCKCENAMPDWIKQLILQGYGEGQENGSSCNKQTKENVHLLKK